MVIGKKVYEDYLDPTSDVWRFMRSTGMIPGGPDDPATISDFLPTVSKDGRHGEAFAYREVFAQGGIATLPGWSYRSQWWIRHVAGRTCPVARGAHGQVLYIDPARDLVIARFGSSQDAPSSLLDAITTEFA